MITNTLNKAALSGNLSCIHIYHTDLWVVTYISGYNAYVTNFHLQHSNKGNKDAFIYAVEKALTNKFQQTFQSKFIKSNFNKLHITSCEMLGLYHRIFRDLILLLKLTQLTHDQKK